MQKSALATAIIAVFWLGMLGGVSFLATPVKFLAPSLTLPVALDVGRQTFGLFGKIEVILALALASAAFVAGRLTLWWLAGALLVAEFCQVLWLLPVLDARVQVILDGGVPSSSSAHWIYVAGDGAKIVGLVIVAGTALRWIWPEASVRGLNGPRPVGAGDEYG